MIKKIKKMAACFQTAKVRKDQREAAHRASENAGRRAVSAWFSGRIMPPEKHSEFVVVGCDFLRTGDAMRETSLDYWLEPFLPIPPFPELAMAIDDRIAPSFDELLDKMRRQAWDNMRQFQYPNIYPIPK